MTTADLDKGGTQTQRRRVYLGPTQGYIEVDEPGAIEYVIDSGTTPIVAGYKGSLMVPWYAIINNWVLVSEAVGSIVIDVYKISLTDYLNQTVPSVANTIAGTDLPTITAAVAARSFALTGWTTEIKQFDFLGFNVNSCTGISKATLIINCTKSIGQISGVGVA